MKRLILLAAALVCSVPGILAQHPLTSDVPCPDMISLKWVMPTDSSVLLYAVYTRKDTTDYVALSRKTCVVQDDCDYRIINSTNIPVYDEAFPMAAYLPTEGQRINFVMEFEKFPLDAPFDIIFSDDEPSRNCLYVRADTSSVAKTNIRRFLKSTPVTYIGKYVNDGKNYFFYDHDGTFVGVECAYYGDYFKVTFDIFNGSDHGIMFNTSNLKGVSNVKKGRKTELVTLTLLDKIEYRGMVKDSDYRQAEKETGGEAVSIVGEGLRAGSWTLPFRSAEYVGLRALSSLASSAEYEMLKPRLKELEDSREERIKDYIQSQSLRKGESCGGFLLFEKVKNMTDITVTLTMDEYDFKYTWTL